MKAYRIHREALSLSWCQALKQDLALQRSAFQSQHTLRSCSSKTEPSLCSVCRSGTSLWRRVGSVECKDNFKFDWLYSVCFYIQYICLPTEFSQSGRIKWIKCWSLKVESHFRFAFNWSWQLYSYCPWGDTGFSHANSPQHPQDATDPGSWESHSNWITALRQSGCWDGGLLSGDLQLRKFRHWEINTEDLFKLFSITKSGGWIPPQFLWYFWPIVHFPRMFRQTNQLQAKSLYSHTSLL